MVEFDHLGYDLNHCGVFLDGIQNFIQTCLHHTVRHKRNFYHGSQVFPRDIIQGLSKDFCTVARDSLVVYNQTFENKQQYRW